jgi:hemerythrin-like metal-binding protein
MDAEHGIQFRLLSALGRAVEEGRCREGVAEILRQFVDYTTVHFLSEQLLMRLHAYPDAAAHAREHETLLAEARKLHDRARSGGVEVSEELVARLYDWWAGHVQTTDRALAACLRRRLSGAGASCPGTPRSADPCAVSPAGGPP